MLCPAWAALLLVEATKMLGRTSNLTAVEIPERSHFLLHTHDPGCAHPRETRTWPWKVPQGVEALFPQHPPTHSVLQTVLVTAAADFSYPMPDTLFQSSY